MVLSSVPHLSSCTLSPHPRSLPFLAESTAVPLNRSSALPLSRQLPQLSGLALPHNLDVSQYLQSLPLLGDNDYSTDQCDIRNMVMGLMYLQPRQKAGAPMLDGRIVMPCFSCVQVQSCRFSGTDAVVQIQRCRFGGAAAVALTLV